VVGGKVKTVDREQILLKLEKLQRRTEEGEAIVPQAIVDDFVRLSALEPTGSVLEVGCGHGRLTLPLIGYLAPSGTYTGLEVRQPIVRELEAAISSAHPNFRFVAADVKNAMYNPDGAAPAWEYQFPFEAESFDLVFLYSVFTHLFPAEVEQYLAEIARVLKTGRRCVISYFLINDDSLRRMEQGETTKSFRHDLGVYRVQSHSFPADNVAYEETYLRALYTRLGLSIVEPIAYGRWCRSDGYHNPDIGQDVITAVKL
jgi:SAM-dependent methyltransferase